MITVYKSQRLLIYTRRGKTLFTCSVALGASPFGHKTREGDGRTPEGRYYICAVNRQSKFHASLGLSYPNARDALSARREGRVGLKDTALIVLAQALRLRPKWKSPLGGFIMIHGESPEGKTGDWTQGCIALSNFNMDRLLLLCRRGETVLVKS